MTGFGETVFKKGSKVFLGSCSDALCFGDSSKFKMVHLHNLLGFWKGLNPIFPKGANLRTVSPISSVLDIMQAFPLKMLERLDPLFSWGGIQNIPLKTQGRTRKETRDREEIMSDYLLCNSVS